MYDNLPGYEYIHIEFDNFKYLRLPNNPSVVVVVVVVAGTVVVVVVREMYYDISRNK